MNEHEEMVYSSMGFDPILILDEPPLYRNYAINITRPGFDDGDEQTNKSIEETEQKTLDHSNSKNDKEIIRLENNYPIEQKSTASESKENPEDKDINVDLDEETNELISADNILINEKNDLGPNELQEVNEDPRRKRRRSSASS